MYNSFKGRKPTLSRKEINWNFIQSPSRIYVEMIFEIPKDR